MSPVAGLETPGGYSWWAEALANASASLKKVRASLSGELPTAGVIAQTLQKVSAALNGYQPFVGTAAAALQKVSAAFNAVMQPDGTLAAALKQVSFTSLVIPVGTAAPVLQPLSTALAGGQEQAGTLAAALVKTQAALAGSQTQAGTLAATAKAPVVALTGAQPYTGLLTAQTRKVAVAFAGGQTFSGVMTAALRKPTAALTGTHTTSSAVAYSAVGNGTFNPGAATSWSYTITVAAGDYVLVSIATDRAAGAVSTCTLGGTAMTLLGSVNHNNNATFGTTYHYGLASATSGSKTVAITVGAAAWVCSNAFAYSGVGSVSSTTSTVGNGGTLSQSPTCTANQMIVQSLAYGMGTSFGGGALADTGGTGRYNAVSTNGCAALAVRDSSASTTFSATTFPAQNWSCLATVLAP